MSSQIEKRLIKFIENHEKKVIHLNRKATESYFNASISGKPEDYQKAADLEIELNKIYANKEDFAELKQIKESNSVNEPLLKRQLDILINEFLGKQIDDNLLEEIVNLQTKNENIYATHRVEVLGKTYSDNQVDEILKTSKDQKELKNIYLASKDIGGIVESDVLKLVELRNISAKQLGFSNYHDMSLLLSEQIPKDIDNIFDNLDSQTRLPFQKMKNEIDNYLSNIYNIKVSELMPWHYQNRFFQESPEIYNTNLDNFFENKDIESITKEYYNSIGLSIEDILKKSDLYEKENKYQHAYCINIDRNDDVRVICNIKSNANWMGTMLHEFGHAAYDKYVDKSLPWLLRTHAHICTTEAIAMFFGRLVTNLTWIEKYTNNSIIDRGVIEESVNKNLKLNLIVFSRWAQVMYRFEKELYQNPNQDLNKLWWDLVEEYQQLKRPANRNKPDWAAKIHVALYPAYYHNYMLGELLASQLQENLLKFNNNYFAGKNVGIYLKEKIFKPGASLLWNKLIKGATGEELNPQYFVQHTTS